MAEDTQRNASRFRPHNRIQYQLGGPLRIPSGTGP